MGRRHHKARFQPGVYVFPGGMLERNDFLAHPSKKLNRSIIPKLSVGNSAPRGQALAMAAIRETYEESGLMVSGDGTIGNSSDPTWSTYRKLDRAPDLSQLIYVGRAITPSVQPIRFHARFFAIDGEHVSGQPRENGELVDLQWVRLSKRDELPMMKVTHLILDTLAGRLSGETTKAPFLYFNKGNKILLWQ